MVPELESGAMIGPGGLQSRVLGSELRKLAAAAAKSGAAVLILNQTRILKDRLAGGLETSTGGSGLKLYSAARIAMAATGRTAWPRRLQPGICSGSMAGDSRKARETGLREARPRKNLEKTGQFCAFLFTSFGPSLMIEIELRRAYPRALRRVCSMV